MAKKVEKSSKTIIQNRYFFYSGLVFMVIGFQFFLICSVPVNQNLQKFGFFPVLIRLWFYSDSVSLISAPQKIFVALEKIFRTRLLLIFKDSEIISLLSKIQK